MRDDFELAAISDACDNMGGGETRQPKFWGGTMSDHHCDRIDEDGHKSRDAIDERGTGVRR